MSYIVSTIHNVLESLKYSVLSRVLRFAIIWVSVTVMTGLVLLTAVEVAVVEVAIAIPLDVS